MIERLPIGSVPGRRRRTPERATRAPLHLGERRQLVVLLARLLRGAQPLETRSAGDRAPRSATEARQQGVPQQVLVAVDQPVGNIVEQPLPIETRLHPTPLADGCLEVAGGTAMPEVVAGG